MLCEGTGSNVFCVFDGQIITPPLSSGCLAGVTRELVLEITDALEEDIAMRAFLLADEVFLTSTGRWVQSAHQIDGRRLVPGKTTARRSAEHTSELQSLMRKPYAALTMK